MKFRLDTDHWYSLLNVFLDPGSFNPHYLEVLQVFRATSWTESWIKPQPGNSLWYDIDRLICTLQVQWLNLSNDLPKHIFLHLVHIIVKNYVRFLYTISILSTEFLWFVGLILLTKRKLIFIVSFLRHTMLDLWNKDFTLRDHRAFL